MPTDLPIRQRLNARKKYARYGEFLLNAAMLLSVLVLGAMVTVRAQIYALPEVSSLSQVDPDANFLMSP